MQRNLKLVNILLAMLLSAVSTLPATAQDQVSAGDQLPLDPQVTIGKLDNGLTYYIHENQEPKERAQLYLVVKAGSLQETDSQLGLAHFTEHMAFNGTEHFPKNELIDYLQRAGVRFGAELNAYTNFGHTVYQLPLPTDDSTLLQSGFQILADWSAKITFDDEEIDKERGVIVEEDRQRGKNANERMNKQLLPVLLKDSRYAERLPIGKMEIVENFEHQTLKDFYNSWYRPDLQAVIAVGDFDKKQIERYIKTYFDARPASEGKELGNYDLPDNNEPLVKIVTDPEFPYTVATVMYKHDEQLMKTTDDLKQAIKNSAINSMIAQRLSEKVRNGNAPFVQAAIRYGSYQGGIAPKDALSVLLVAKDPEHLREAVEGVMSEVYRMVAFGFTPTEWERTKMNFLKSIDDNYEERDHVNSEVYTNKYLQHFLKGAAFMSPSFTKDFYHEYLPELSIDDINTVAAKWVEKENQLVILQSAEKTKDQLPDEETLLNWVNTVPEGVNAYVDDSVDEPLIEDIPEHGTIVKEKELEGIGTTEWTLSNGVRVVVKPTDFKNEEIRFGLFSSGGYSKADTTKIFSGRMADNIIGSSGLSKFTPTQVNKLLTGKSVSVSPYINLYEEGIQGETNSKDLEVALQVINLYFTKPRMDTAIFNTLMDNQRIIIRAKPQSPMAIFQDSVTSVMQGNSAYVRPATLDDIDQIELQRAYEFFKQRFADANDFTFVFTGSIPLDTLRPLVEKYIATLPVLAQEESIKNVGVGPAKGQVTITVKKGLEDKALVVLVYHDKYKYSLENNLQLQCLKVALEDRLMKRLREKEGGVYSPSVSINYSNKPEARYSVVVTFNCATEKVDPLINATEDELAMLRKDGPSSDEVEKFTAQKTRQLETQVRSNNFWVSYIKGIYMNKRKPDYIDDIPEELEKLQSKKSNKQMKRKLDIGNRVELKLLPDVESEKKSM